MATLCGRPRRKTRYGRVAAELFWWLAHILCDLQSEGSPLSSDTHGGMGQHLDGLAWYIWRIIGSAGMGRAVLVLELGVSACHGCFSHFSIGSSLCFTRGLNQHP